MQPKLLTCKFGYQNSRVPNAHIVQHFPSLLRAMQASFSCDGPSNSFVNPQVHRRSE